MATAGDGVFAESGGGEVKPMYNTRQDRQRPVIKALRSVLIHASLLLLSFGAFGQTSAQTSTPPAVAAPAPVLAPVQPWQVQTLPTRILEGGQQATVAVVTRVSAAVAPKHVLLFQSPYTTPIVKVANGASALAFSDLWLRASAQLATKGIALAIADVPSDANKRGLALRPSSDMANDLSAVAQHLKKQFPGLPIHLAGLGAGAGALLDSAANVNDLSRIVIASGDFRNNRTTDWRNYKHPVMLIHAPSAQCDFAPFMEADLVARNNHFVLLQAGYSQQETKPSCLIGSQHVLAKLETELTTTVAAWLDGAAPPPTIGFPTPSPAWREQLVSYTAPATLGTNRLEMTLLYPTGPGPYPLAVFNHGDIEMDSSYVRYQSRYVDRIVAREFLQLGWAVAFPSRAGVGLSEGNYRSFRSGDADATYKARIQAQDILPVFEYLKTNPAIDAGRIIVTGQSAGGYAAMHLATLNLPGVVGAVDFSGGRTDKLVSDAAGFLNAMMVRGFEEYGKTTKVPTLWVFAENDSRYTANTIRASHKAFVDAGGQATLILSPPIDTDGHFVHNKPDVWRSALKEYLTQLGGVQSGK